jgi:hypothetical protein
MPGSGPFVSVREHGENASHVSTGDASRALAAFRSHTIVGLRIHGWTNVAAGLRWAASDYTNALTLFGLDI